MSKPKNPRTHPDYHWITCSACGERAWVKNTRRFLCDRCFTEGGDSKKVPWGEVNKAVSEYLIKEGILLLELVPSGKWKGDDGCANT